MEAQERGRWLLVTLAVVVTNESTDKIMKEGRIYLAPSSWLQSIRGTSQRREHGGGVPSHPRS